MRSLVISDLHSNHPALRTVMNHVRRKRIDRIVCLGDFVGYGAQPNQVVDLVREYRAPKLYIRGNHDRVVSGADDGEGFNHAARSAALWTRDHLSGPNRRFISDLVVGPYRDPRGDIFCHGSPLDEDEYIFSEYAALRAFNQFDGQVIFYGHTHLPLIFVLDERTKEMSAGLIRGATTLTLEPGKRYLVNPGSVGQPRDRNPQTSFAIFDDERRAIQFFRLTYEIENAQIPILRAGLPQILATRLSHGT